MIERIEIVEVISRSAQGATRPFLCRAANKKLYYVKGNYAGRQSLRAEWIAGRLGHRIGLPIPPFAQGFLNDEVTRFSAREDIGDLGKACLFASEKIEGVDEMRWPLAEMLDQRLRAKILLFDWWIGNGDRTLTPDGGNPNLLWRAAERQVAVIDHNLAFEDIDAEGFWRDHIFRRDATTWDGVFREDMELVLRAALSDVPKIWGELPEEWTESATGFTLQSLTDTLSRFGKDTSSFWRKE